MTNPRLPALKDLAWLRDAALYVQRYNTVADETGKALLIEPTRRQMRTALEIIRRLKRPTVGSASAPPRRRGVLLADDVGLGKTTVGALVAGIFAGRGFRVRVLAPNAPMARRWLDELQGHQEVLRNYGYRYQASTRIRKLRDHRIAISTHVRGANSGHLSCDLLIVDEAHRAKNDGSKFAKALKSPQHAIGHVLILTATPFSIAPAELGRMLDLVGADDSVRESIDRAADALQTLWNGSFSGPSFADQLVQACSDAIRSIAPYVIRHGVSTLPSTEQRRFGTVEEGKLDSHTATNEQLEILIRADRALTLGKRVGAWRMLRTNDPRFHVGWNQLRKALQSTRDGGRRGKGDPVLQRHARAIGAQLKLEGDHPKMVATGDAVLRIVRGDERVVLFCDHHETARELALYLGRRLRTELPIEASPSRPWVAAYRNACRFEADKRGERRALDGFLDWLASAGMAAQVSSWLPERLGTANSLTSALRTFRVRPRAWPANTTAEIAEELRYLWTKVRQSSSSRALFAQGGQAVCGANLDAQRIVAVTDHPPDLRGWERSIFHPGSPDTVLALFNSPFGPDVLVVTDAFSEGFDLHRYCRHIIHYELDPSPMRTIQRNGRLRRVDCWAARSGKPVVISYPAFLGTRDERLVEIMRSRLDQFDLLLGGIGRDLDKEASDSDARYRQEEVLNVARRKLARAARRLCVVKGQ
jgi:hypothetical protein